MDLVEKLLIGLTLFVITSLIAYIFRIRQLYLSVPKFYKNSPLVTNGTLSEINIYNRGKLTEEDIEIKFSPDLKIELLASSSIDVEVEKSMMKIRRLHKGTEISILLLVENGFLQKDTIASFSSKATKGKVFKDPANVPIGYANGVLGVIAFLSIWLLIGATIYAYQWYGSLEYKALKGEGWSDLGNYADSKLKASYSGIEFPVRYLSLTTKSGVEYIRFEVVNKTALPLKVNGEIDGINKKKIDILDIYGSVTVSPLSTGILELPSIKIKEGNGLIKFNFTNGSDFIYNVKLSYADAKVVADSKE